MAGKLGIVAGSGELPLRVIEACRAANRPFFVLALEQSCELPTVVGTAHAWIRLGAGATGLRLLRDTAVEELVMAGAVRRPSLWALRPDWRALQFFAQIGFRALRDFGDDALFRAIIGALEHEGFRVVGIDSVLADHLAPLGPLGQYRPDAEAEADIAAGLGVAHAHGARDLGQAVIVHRGGVVGVEQRDGTDALIRRCAGSRGVLVKMAKPGQDRRADLPAIGPGTIMTALARSIVTNQAAEERILSRTPAFG